MMRLMTAGSVLSLALTCCCAPTTCLDGTCNDNTINTNSTPDNEKPQPDAGTGRSVLTGEIVVLSAAGSTDPDNDPVSFSWTQIAGPEVELNKADQSEPSFLPVQPGTYVFRVTVSDGKVTAFADVQIIVLAPPVPQVTLAGSWNGAERMNLDLNWKLPGGAWYENIARADWGPSGTEAAVYPIAGLPAGVHEFWFTLAGDGRSTNCIFSADFLNLKFLATGLFQAPFRRKIITEVFNGQAHILFQGWLQADELAAGGPSGLYPAETQIAWRNGDDEVNCDLWMVLPNGTPLERYQDDWALQGFERTVYPRGVTPQAGTHQINFEFNGSGRSADVTHFVQFPGLNLRMDERILGLERRMIGLDFQQGAAHLLFNGWRDASATDAGGLTGVHPVELLAGWRNASDEVNVNIALIDPDGIAQDVWRNDWLPQGFEYARIPQGIALKDGIWVLYFELDGSGRSAEINFDARFANWSFSRTETLLGYTERRITLSVAGGIASVLTNTWN